MTEAEFFKSQAPIIEEMMMGRPVAFHSDEYEAAIRYTLFCYAEESPIHGRYQDVDQKRVYSENTVKSSDVVHNEMGSMYQHCLEQYLIKHVHSYRYEFLVTCHILLSDNNKELRKPITNITEEDKRAKTSEIKSRLLQTNRDIIDQIDQLTQTIFIHSKELMEKHSKKRPTLEERVKKDAK